MPRWLNAALDYLPRWLEFQVAYQEQPGCVVAVAHRGRLELEAAFGKGLTPRHRFRVASHSKTFAAAAVMKLAEARRLRLADRIGRYVEGLHPRLAHATLAELLAHASGVVRDGPDSGQFSDRRPFLRRTELRADLALPPVLPRNTRFKYSNHGYGLLGLAIEAVTGEAYVPWLQREIIGAAGLRETLADGPPPRGMPLAEGHSSRVPLGQRVVIPGRYSTNAMAPAAGVISTAADLVRFFSLLAPSAKSALLSPASRRAMLRPRWGDPYSSIERYYGLGVMRGRFAGWDWFGHSGGLQGYITRTAVLPEQHLAIAVLSNAIDGLAHAWLEGALHIFRVFADAGAPSPTVRAWRGRWWSLWNPVDLVPAGRKVFVARPDYLNPFLDAPQIRVTRGAEGVIALAGGYASHGEPARLDRSELRLGGARFRTESRVAREMASRYSG